MTNIALATTLRPEYDMLTGVQPHVLIGCRWRHVLPFLPPCLPDPGSCAYAARCLLPCAVRFVDLRGWVGVDARRRGSMDDSTLHCIALRLAADGNERRERRGLRCSSSLRVSDSHSLFF